MTAEGDALVAALGRFADILRRGDSASAETVDINENANDGNEPAGIAESSDVEDARTDLWCEINELCNMYAGYTYNSRAIAQQERVVSAAIDSLMGKCSHA
jgi:hypothetical protein